jgi:DNA primase
LFFPDSVLEDIKSRIDLVEYISRYVDLRRAGANFKGLCPFHQEKTPSFMVSPSKMIFKCFGCGVGGNLITFLRDIENISFTEAVKRLAKESGVSISQYTSKQALERETENEKLYRVNDEARDFFRNQLFSDKGKAALDYLHKRGIQDDVIEEFSLGYAPNEWEALYNHLKAKGFEEEVILRAGLAVKRENNRVSDKFRHRLVFPILNLSGLTCGFTGRVLDNKNMPKYLNSPETSVYQKSRLLYGLFNSREPVRAEKSAVIVEGNTDLLTLYQGGVKNVVAASGTAFTASQALLLKRFCDNVIIIYDGDAAGQEAARRGISILINANLIVRVLALPEGEDPDSYFRKKGLAQFREEIRGGKNIVDFVIDNFEARFDLSVPENKPRLANELGPLLNAISDPILKTELVKRAALRTGIREDLLLSRRSRTMPTNRRDQASRQVGGDLRSQEAQFEKEVLRLIIKSADKDLTTIKEAFSQEDFTVQPFRALFNAIIQHNGFNETVLTHLDEASRRVATEIAMEPDAAPVVEGSNAMGYLIKRVKEKRLRRKLSEIRHQMSLKGSNQETLLQEFKQVTEELNQLQTP